MTSEVVAFIRLSTMIKFNLKYILDYEMAVFMYTLTLQFGSNHSALVTALVASCSRSSHGLSIKEVTYTPLRHMD